ncbi:hypothetical protein IVB46_44270 [Bradyrhizobium sp. 61]|uniref:hypothetical protein n=1 Tax=Bradyrhizobium sp. 61 TaxID=2782679 RepID=UPI001FF77680|nr:hypothetical protein [Bradyrhizobium sp. 61]MCK1282254.1 hypothetical protein [Bradyrhizobium sp. 61]
MSQFGFVKVTVQGVQGPGPMSAPDVKAGDRLLLGYGPNPANVEQIISTDGEVQQQNSFDWSGQPPFDLIYLRGI